MQHKPWNWNKIPQTIVAALGAAGLALSIHSAAAATYYLSAADGSGSSSYNSAGNWYPTGGGAPSSGNIYLVTNGTDYLRTPSSGTSPFVFAGSSLILSNGMMVLKSASGSTLAFTGGNGLFMNNGMEYDGNTPNNSITISGTITLQGFATFDPRQPGNVVTLSAAIGGAGILQMATPGVSSGVGGLLILSGANTYAGSTVLDAASTLQLSGSGTLGATTNPVTFYNITSTNSSVVVPVNLSLLPSLSGGWGTLDLNGTSQTIGALNAAASGPAVLNSKSGTTSTLTIGNNNGNNGSYAGILTNGAGTLALTLTNASTQILSGANTYTGATAVQGGTLEVDGSLSTNTVTVSGGTLEGSGTIGGAVTINGGTLSAGSATSVGKLTINNTLTVSSGTVALRINKTGGTITNDALSGLSSAAYGGTLTVTNITTGGTQLAFGDTFTLVNSTHYSGGFVTTNLPALPAGLAWSTVNLTANGSIVVVATNTTTTPTFTPASGTYQSPLSVTIASATGGATIYYTTDGSNPTTSGTTVSGTTPVTVAILGNTSAETIMAYASLSGYTNSAIASATYSTFVATNSLPVFTPAPGTNTFLGALSVTIASTNSGATIHYTTDGSNPTTSGTVVSGATPVTVVIPANTSDETLMAYVSASNYSNSAVASATYTTYAPSSITLNYSTAGSGAVLMGAGSDWNSTGYWWDGLSDGGLPASTLAGELPGVPFVVPPGSFLRTTSGTNATTFPGAELDLDGDGNFVNDTGNVNDSTSLLANKTGSGSGYTASLYFTNLVINGGRVDDGVTYIPVFNGGMTIGSNNAYFYVDPTAGDRGFQINSVISGAGTIQLYLYSGLTTFQTAFTNDLDIAGTNNPFTGAWDVTQGVLLGSGTNSLGTNSIDVEANGALETMYNLNSSNATLTLNGQMFLHQNDTFASVTVAGTSLPPGTYTWAQLNAYSPANFPASWTEKFGSTSNTASGSLTVLAGNGSPLYIAGQPQNLTVFAGNTVNFAVIAGGLPPLSYQWQAGLVGSGGPYTNLSNGGQFSGTTSNTLTIQNVNTTNTLDYVVVVSNSYGTIVSSPATLTVNPIPPAITLSYAQSGAGGVLEPAGTDWNSTGYWWDGTSDGGLPASTLAVELPGIPFVALPGSLLRTPNGALSATFPGTELDLDGDGNFVNDQGNVSDTTSLLACKQGNGPGNSGSLYFTNLVINGGRVDDGVTSIPVFNGGITIGSNNAYFYIDPTDGDRGFQINSTISGAGTIQLYLYSGLTAFQTAYTNDLDIAGANNPFTGQWLVSQGPLLGSGTNSLGTNSIDVEANGALETLYNLNDPGASLNLNGLLYLHQQDTFQSVTVAGNVLYAGTYTAAQLNALYPANFPASWTQLYGSSYSIASGSLTVLQPAANLAISTQFSAGNLTLSWTNGVLLQATNLLGPWTTNTTAATPYTVPATNAQMFFKLSP